MKRIRNVTNSLKAILLCFLAFSLVFTVVLLSIAVSLYNRNLEINSQQSWNIIARQAENQLTAEMENILTSLYSIATKKEIKKYLKEDRSYKADNVMFITSLLSDLPIFVPSISDVLLISPDYSISAMTYNNTDVRIFSLKNQIAKSYFDSDNQGRAIYNIPCSQPDQYALAIVVPVTSSSQTRQGIVMAFCTINKMLESIGLPGEQSSIFVNDQLFWPTDAANEDKANDTENILLYEQITGWKISVPLSNFEQQETSSLNVKTWLLVSFCIFAIVETVLCLAIHKAIIAPIRNISKQSTRIRSAEGNIDNPSPGRSEITNLVDNINEMLTRTRQLSATINEAQMRLMNMELLRLKERNMFLQVQINPHFLFNMLECICGMAASEENWDVREMTQLLAKMYRYCLQSPESTLEEEIDCIHIYEKMIRLRYSEKIQIETDIPEDLLVFPVIRMILEPIVENAVQHGFPHQTNKAFLVRISASLEENALHLRVEDNGCGMDDESIRQINARLAEGQSGELQTGSRIGILNVGSRLKLSYGNESGIVLEKNRWNGLTVHMLIYYPT